MAEKFTDLYGSIMEAFDTFGGEPWDVLTWIDDHRDQAPSPTIRTSEVEAETDGQNGDYIAGFIAGVNAVGGKVIEDPQPPSNTVQMFSDLDELTGDGFLIHDRHKEKIAQHLTRLGWVKTPGDDDGH